MKNIYICVHPCPCGFYGDAQKPCTCACRASTAKDFAMRSVIRRDWYTGSADYFDINPNELLQLAGWPTRKVFDINRACIDNLPTEAVNVALDLGSSWFG